MVQLQNKELKEKLKETEAMRTNIISLRVGKGSNSSEIGNELQVSLTFAEFLL